MSFNCASCAATKAVWGGRRHGRGQHCQHGDFHQLCRAALRKVGKQLSFSHSIHVTLPLHVSFSFEDGRGR